MEEASWIEASGGGIMEEASRRRHHGEALWKMLASLGWPRIEGLWGIQVASEGIPRLAKPRRVSQDDLRDMAS